MRSVVCPFADTQALRRAMELGARDLVLDLSRFSVSEEINDGDWVLAIVEMPQGRATAVAARATKIQEHIELRLEQRDWATLAAFATQVGHEEETPPTDRSPGSTKRSASRSARVLLVDDDPSLREVIGAMLGAVGLKVTAVATAEEALDKVKRDPFELLVLDWTLPGMSGLDLCRKIREIPAVSAIPVLFLTANVSSKDMIEAFASGADDYVTKPFRAPELGARIFGLLRRAGSAK